SISAKSKPRAKACPRADRRLRFRGPCTRNSPGAVSNLPHSFILIICSSPVRKEGGMFSGTVVIVGPAGSGKTERLLTAYRRALAADDPGCGLWLAPTRRAA